MKNDLWLYGFAAALAGVARKMPNAGDGIKAALDEHELRFVDLLERGCLRSDLDAIRSALGN